MLTKFAASAVLAVSAAAWGSHNSGHQGASYGVDTTSRGRGQFNQIFSHDGRHSLNGKSDPRGHGFAYRNVQAYKPAEKRELSYNQLGYSGDYNGHDAHHSTRHAAPARQVSRGYGQRAAYGNDRRVD